jgi:aminopeptidase N
VTVNRPLAFALVLLAAPAAARPAVKGLSQKEAALRSVMVSSVSYELAVSLDSAAAEYEGEAAISFLYKEPAAPLTLDFDSGTIVRLSVNGAAVERPDYNGLFLTLPAGALKPGRNEVRLAYRHPYSATGEGLYRFVDPEDGRVYLYTDFEPFNANKLFPCFDQPDLKAPYALTVDAPAGWSVVSTARETGRASYGAGRTRWTFPATPPLSTYVYSLHAGEYAVWESTAGSVPLRLFARRSLAKYLEPEEWFDTARKGLAFFGDYFGIPYPYGKYDQLIVPDYNAGAMENAGAITFSERYIRRGARTRSEREDLAETILHEMAHMWFGDLVTPSWWDGLWLNESFASYMSSLAGERAAGYPESWLSFAAGDKAWAYWEDEQPTTHPVEARVDDTETAFTSFDGITYGKGQAALRQLAHLIGEDAFRDGVRLYLKRLAYRAATEADFFAALSQAGGGDLSSWRRQWLETAGMNTTRVEVRCRDGKVESAALRQEGRPLRRRKTDVALYDERMKPLARASVLARKKTTPIPELSGAGCPAFAFANAGDYDYSKTPLDAASLKTALSSLDRLPSPLDRALAWHALWQMVRDGRLSAAEYGRAVLAQIGGETDYETAKAVLLTVYGKTGDAPSILRYDPSLDAGAFASLFWERLSGAPKDSDMQKLWLDGFLQLAVSPERLRALLDGRGPAALDQDRRWLALQRLSALGDPGAAALIEAEAARDRSDTGAKAALAARAAAPGEANKRLWLTSVSDPASAASLGDQRAVMDALFPREQSALRRTLAPEFYAALPRLAAVKDDEFLSAYASALEPTGCSSATAAALGAFLRGHPALPASAAKHLKIARAEDERCARARSSAGF